MIKFMLFHGAAEQSAVLFIPENYVVHTISKINVEKSCIIYSRGVIAFGILLLVVAIIWLIAVLVYNSNRGDNLAISLNSGSTLYFNCKDRAFLNKVVNAMLGSIKGKNQTTYSISFDKCQISGGVLHNSNLIER